MLYRFREILGEFPRYNKSGRNRQSKDEFDYFSRKQLDKILSRIDAVTVKGT